MTSPIQVVPALSSLRPLARYRFVLTLSFPIIMALTSQNLLNIVDTWIVGRLGSLALAAVALAGTTNWVLSAFFIGLGSGVQAFVARRVGEGDHLGAASALDRTLLFTLQFVVPLSVVACFASAALLNLITSREQVLALGAPYLAARLAGLPFLAANFAYRGYWNGIGRSQVYLRTILVIHVTNVVVSYLLVFGIGGLPRLGVLGAGVGSTVAQGVGTAYYAMLGRRQQAAGGFLASARGCSLGGLLRRGTPAGIQTLLFSTGFLIFFAITDRVGARELGASQVLVTMALVSILPAVGFGLGSATLVGQALGAARPDDAREWGWLTVRLGCAVVGSIGLLEALAAEPLLTLFIPTDPAAAALGVPALQIIGGVMAADSVGVILSNALIGAGAATQVMVWSVVTQYGVFLPGAWFLGLHLEAGLWSLWVAFAVYRVLFGLATAVMWRGSRWTRVRV